MHFVDSRRQSAFLQWISDVRGWGRSTAMRVVDIPKGVLEDPLSMHVARRILIIHPQEFPFQQSNVRSAAILDHSHSPKLTQYSQHIASSKIDVKRRTAHYCKAAASHSPVRKPGKKPRPVISQGQERNPALCTK